MPKIQLNIRRSGDFSTNLDSSDKEAAGKAASDIEEQIRTFIKANGGEGLNAYISVSISVSTPYPDPVSCNTMAYECGTAIRKPMSEEEIAVHERILGQEIVRNGLSEDAITAIRTLRSEAKG